MVIESAVKINALAANFLAAFAPSFHITLGEEPTADGMA